MAGPLSPVKRCPPYPLGAYHGLPVYPLKDVLSRVPLPPNCPLEKVSDKWRCVLAPKITEPSLSDLHDDDALIYLDKGIPTRLGRCRSEDVYDTCGPDGLKFLTDSRWNVFPKPKIAFKSGWAGPGTNMESVGYHKLIGSFQEVFEHRKEVDLPLTDEELAAAASTEDAVDDVGAPEILNLQLFHREDTSTCPQITPLGDKLVWPSFVTEGAICDVATRASQRGAVTWWHLDDSGEFVEQTALPLMPAEGVLMPPPLDSIPAEERVYYANIDRELYCVDENPSSVPAKMFLYGPPESYDWLMHDDESHVSGKVASLDIFHTPDEALPKDASLLPIMALAVLESGGRPLISPPNIPHLVVTVNDCVMVEQRRVAHLWLEEVSYFLRKCAHWQTNPIIYDYLSRDLQDDGYVGGQLIPLLMDTYRAHDGGSVRDSIVRRRAVTALYTIAVNDKHYGLSEESRKSLLALLTTDTGDAEKCALLNSSVVRGTRRLTLRQRLEAYWDVKQYWPKPGCVLRCPDITPKSLVSPCVHAEEDWYLPVVYCKSSPVFGSEKRTIEETVEEYFDMKALESKEKDLHAYLRTRKGELDNLLEELF